MQCEVLVRLKPLEDEISVLITRRKVALEKLSGVSAWQTKKIDESLDCYKESIDGMLSNHLVHVSTTVAALADTIHRLTDHIDTQDQQLHASALCADLIRLYHFNFVNPQIEIAKYRGLYEDYKSGKLDYAAYIAAFNSLTPRLPHVRDADAWFEISELEAARNSSSYIHAVPRDQAGAVAYIAAPQPMCLTPELDALWNALKGAGGNLRVPPSSKAKPGWWKPSSV